MMPRDEMETLYNQSPRHTFSDKVLTDFADLSTNIVTDFTNTYCEASELHFSKTIQKYGKKFRFNKAGKYIGFNYTSYFTFFRGYKNYKQIHYNTDINEWLYTEEKEHGNISTNITTIHTSGDSGLPENNSQEKLNNFEDFGFTADFEGDIFFKDANDIHIGVVLHDMSFNGDGSPYPPIAHIWDNNGKAYEIVNKECTRKKLYDLTPIKKEWNEYPENFPCWMFHIPSGEVHRCISYNGYIVKIKFCDGVRTQSHDDYRLATLEDLETPYYKGKMNENN